MTITQITNREKDRRDKEYREGKYKKKYAKKKKPTIDLSKRQEKPTINLSKPKTWKETATTQRNRAIEKTKNIPVLGTALKVMSSTKTTKILAATLATLITIGQASAAFTIGRGGVAAVKGTQTVAGLGTKAAQAAAGKSSAKWLLDPAQYLKVVQTNTKIASLQASYISKIFAGATNPLVLGGVVVSAISFQAMMVPNEKGDAVMSLGIGVNAAVKAGDMEGAEKMYDVIKELSRPSTLEKLEAMIPIWGYIAAVIDKIKAARMVGDITMSRLEKKLAAKEDDSTEAGTSSAEEDWDAIYAAELDRQDAKREADAQARTEAIAAWATAKEAERQADAAYWKKKIEEADARAREKAKENEAYWLEVYKQRENSAPSNLNFGLF